MLCRAKINLTLHVGAPMAVGAWAGYHPIESLVVFADYGDQIQFEPSDHPSLTIDGPFGHDLTPGSDNLIVRALDLCDARSQAVRLTKNLPLSSGLGGGSANAAAVLRTFDPAGLVDASAIGADVPVCRLSQTAMMEGVGDVVTALSGLGRLPAVLVNPGVAMSTARIFAHYDALSPPAVPAKTALNGSLLDRARSGMNDLQAASILEAPIIGDVLDAISQQPGCQLARMSGSGATCFGLFETMQAAEVSAKTLSANGWWSVATWLGEAA
ncbi:4-diphosphocytidyl-2-C-methyl-D-erythritol kinase [Algimonas ampicilliniresistens]|uniref:4-diphosphocytidyl-2-C-methyl-D-erythritol kinase n=1 Tax=Algimonas ampicilliniresistens TaxID=1298735 RepID=A0ABQ5V6M6_9PROT|nr:4-(cytidine 5'-diphospho)-2-C-methyl-D-erythritol kinase [Algimonas ampicilliniresistens]GLQ23040.1 4-diphosphocytidyl-2-C-methyl-D-erythritol kinase [Algimonas ampicilliniresistens]